MIKDIKVLLDNKNAEYKYEIINEEILCSINVNREYKNLDIVYDENVYESIIFDKQISFEKISQGKLRIDIKNIKTDKFSFKVKINYKYLIKAVYNYINNFINIDTLIGKLNIFKELKETKKYKKEVDLLINKLEENSIEELLLEPSSLREKLEEVIVNDELYLSFVKKMDTKDLMLLITCYIRCNRIPHIDQEIFNELVIEAINYDYALENVWRLAMNYDEKGFDFGLIDKFFVISKDAWYLSEYITSIEQVDHEKIVNMVVETKDKEFIKKILEDNFIENYLDDKYKELLKKELDS